MEIGLLVAPPDVCVLFSSPFAVEYMIRTCSYISVCDDTVTVTKWTIIACQYSMIVSVHLFAKDKC